MECLYSNNCVFFKKYQSSQIFAWKGFISNYCKGEKMVECKRKEFIKTNGFQPSNNMMPSGQVFND